MKEEEIEYLTQLTLKYFGETEIENDDNNAITKQCIEWLQNKDEKYYTKKYRLLIYGDYKLLFDMVCDIVREIKFRHSCTIGLTINGRVI
jgi:hypothetical protein